MSRLFILVEGATEEEFVNEILRPHLITNHSFDAVDARIVGNSRLRENRKGIKAWSAVRKDITNRLLSDKGVYSTLLVDYYALPQGSIGEGGWPGRSTASKLPFPQKATTVQSAIALDIRNELPNPNDHKRFIPFLVMHEFEALLFSDPKAMARGFNHQDAEPDFAAIASAFKTPEEINDSRITSPSWRIQKIFEDRGYGKYSKPLLGNLAALEVTLPVIRAKCPHFNEWLCKLERLGAAVAAARRGSF